MDKYIGKLQFDFQTNQRILNLIAEIDMYKGKWAALEKGANRYLRELKNMATIASVGSSTRIEGATLTDREIEELLKSVRVSSLKTRDEQEVAGYYDTLELIYESYEHIPLSENYIKQLHQNLLRYSDKDMRHRGGYKSLSNKVVANYPGGIQKVIFKTTDVHLVQGEMSDLIRWTNEQFAKGEIHPLIVVSVFIYEFLSIHPFQDGNGRLSRLLTTLLLLQQGYTFIQYISFEHLIEETKKEYYQALMEGQKRRGHVDENISAWVLYFLERLHILIQKLDAKYDLFKSKGGYLNPRQKELIAYLKEHQPLKLSDMAGAFKEVSIHTLKKDLQYMVKEQMVRRLGRGKGSVYVLDEEEAGD